MQLHSHLYPIHNIIPLIGCQIRTYFFIIAINNVVVGDEKERHWMVDLDFSKEGRDLLISCDRRKRKGPHEGVVAYSDDYVLPRLLLEVSKAWKYNNFLVVIDGLNYSQLH